MFTLKLFGGLSISSAEGPLTGRAFQRRRLAILSLLATAPTGAMAREKLIAYLWPESDTEQGRHLLSVSVYELRKALGEEALHSIGDELRINPEVILSDVREFEEAIARGELERAISLYTGPFLDGFFVGNAPEFERWQEAERERLAHAYAGALESVAEERAAAGDLRGAVEAWRQLAVHNQYNSQVALRLMEALAAIGDRAGAIQHARGHETLLREELGVEPNPEIAALAERLRQEPPTHAVSSSTVESTGPGATGEAGGEVEVPVPPASSTAELSIPEIAGTAPPASGPIPVRASGHTAADPRSPPLPGRAIRRGVPATLLLLAVLVGAWMVAQRWNQPPFSQPTIAVLPFVDTSPEGDYEYLGDGITDELINTLSQVEGIRVAARTSSFTFKGKDATVRTIGEELGVGNVLEGSIRRVGDRLRVHAQLVNVRSGYNLWAETYEGDAGDIFAIEEEISRAIVNRLRGRHARGANDPAVRSYTENVEAYHSYLRGRYFWNRRDDPQLREENLRRSIEHFQQALAEDSTYAPAYAGLADSYASLVPTIPREEAFAMAKAAAQRAIELDPRLAEAHIALARILVFHEWEWEGARRHYRRALELSPNNATARQWYGMYLLHQGELQEAIREIERARQLDPLSASVNNDVGRVLYNARRYDEAIEQYRKTLELHPSSADAHLYLALTYVEKAMFTEAMEQLQRWSQLTGESPTLLLGYVHATAGRDPEARQTLQQLEEASPRRRIPPAGLALVYAQLGETDRAFEQLEAALAERSSFLLFLKVSPRLDPLRSDPRFDRLLRQVGLN